MLIATALPLNEGDILKARLKFVKLAFALKFESLKTIKLRAKMYGL